MKPLKSYIDIEEVNEILFVGNEHVYGDEYYTIVMFTDQNGVERDLNMLEISMGNEGIYEAARILEKLEIKDETLKPGVEKAIEVLYDTIRDDIFMNLQMSELLYVINIINNNSNEIYSEFEKHKEDAAEKTIDYMNENMLEFKINKSDDIINYIIEKMVVEEEFLKKKKEFQAFRIDHVMNQILG